MNNKILIVVILIIIIIIAVIAMVLGINQNSENEELYNNNINEGNVQNITSADENNISNNTNANTIQTTQNEGDEENMENARIKLTVNGNEIFVRLDDNVASRELLEMLPLTLNFEDFNSTEKIATLPSELSTEGLPSGYTPKVGDFSYYAPWGNLSIFYEDFRYSNSLYKLGAIESGTEILGNMNGNFEVTIERVN